MSMQNLRAFPISKFTQSLRATAINARLTMQMCDGKAILLQAFTDLTDFIQNRHDAAEFVAQSTHHLIHQHFRPANSQRMDHVADRGTIVDGCDANVWLCGLYHDVEFMSGMALASC